MIVISQRNMIKFYFLMVLCNVLLKTHLEELQSLAKFRSTQVIQPILPNYAI